jgi:hypothetical protein
MSSVMRKKPIEAIAITTPACGLVARLTGGAPNRFSVLTAIASCLSSTCLTGVAISG